MKKGKSMKKRGHTKIRRIVALLTAVFMTVQGMELHVSAEGEKRVGHMTTEKATKRETVPESERIRDDGKKDASGRKTVPEAAKTPALSDPGRTGIGKNVSNPEEGNEILKSSGPPEKAGEQGGKSRAVRKMRSYGTRSTDVTVQFNPEAGVKITLRNRITLAEYQITKEETVIPAGQYDVRIDIPDEVNRRVKEVKFKSESGPETVVHNALLPPARGFLSMNPVPVGENTVFSVTYEGLSEIEITNLSKTDCRVEMAIDGGSFTVWDFSVERLVIPEGQEVKVRFMPKNGKRIEAVDVNGTVGKESDPGFSVEETNVIWTATADGENKVLNVTCSDLQVINVSGNEVNTYFKAKALSAGSIVKNDGHGVVLKNDATEGLLISVLPKTPSSENPKAGLSVEGSADSSTVEWHFNTNKTLNEVHMYYRAEGENFSCWHKLNLTEGYRILFDKTKPVLEIKKRPEDEAYPYFGEDGRPVLEYSDNASPPKSVEYVLKAQIGTEEKRIEGFLPGNAFEEQEGKYYGFLYVAVNETFEGANSVTVEARPTDQAGNVGSWTAKTFKFYPGTPKIRIVSIKKNGGVMATDGLKLIFNEYVDVTFAIQDIDECFTANNAEKVWSASIRYDGNPLPAPDFQSWSKVGDEWQRTLTLKQEGRYSVTPTYRNLAGTEAEDTTPSGQICIFAIDRTAPTGQIVALNQAAPFNQTWTDIAKMPLTYALFNKQEISVRATGTDELSAVRISYLKTKDTEVLTDAELRTKTFQTEEVTVSEDEKFIVYAKLEDAVGNVSFISTRGAVVDRMAPVIHSSADSSVIHNKDIQTTIDVFDGSDEAVGSGLKRVTWQLQKGTEAPSSEQVLFDLPTGLSRWPDGILIGDLKAKISQTIVIPAKEYNSDDVKLIIRAEDLAGNSLKQIEALKINIDPVKASWKFSEAAAKKVIGSRGYFNRKREAKFILKDRLSAFDEAAATAAIHVKAVDIDGNAVPMEADMIQWSTSADEQVATVTFSKDAVYTISFGDYTNKAGNTLKAKDVTASGTTPLEFTIDSKAPTGTVRMDGDAWNKVVSVLTFGLVKAGTQTMTVDAQDTMTPVKDLTIEIWKPVEDRDKKKVKTTAELETLYSDGQFKPYAPMTFSANEEAVVYARIADAVGNVTWLSSEGFVSDHQDPTLELTVVNPAAIYNRTVDEIHVDYKAADAEPNSGIQRLTWQMFKDGKAVGAEKELFKNTIADPTYDELHAMQQKSGRITIPTKDFNSSDVELVMKVTDRAGRTVRKSRKFDIDRTAPEVTVEYDNNTDFHGTAAFAKPRTATIRVQERKNHFSGDDLKAGIEITAKNLAGKDAGYGKSLRDALTWKEIPGKTPDETVFEGEIVFDKDANYTLSVKYQDKAGNPAEVRSSSKAPYAFTVDRKAPTGSLTAVSEEGRTEKLNTLLSTLQFGFRSRGGFKITAETEDETAGIYSVDYHISGAETRLTRSELDAVSEWKKYQPFELKDEGRRCVYLRVIDRAGNRTYIGTDGLIIDRTKPEETLAPEVTMKPEQPVNGYYTKDFAVDIDVRDPANKTDGTASGLKSVKMRVLNQGTVTRDEVLYEFTKREPTYQELKQVFHTRITVDTQINNSNDVRIELTAEDNAGNVKAVMTGVKVDTTRPTIYVAYDNNNPSDGKYYRTARTATVVITERNFNPKDVVLKVTNTDGPVPVLSGWTAADGDGNGDGTTHTATIHYPDDGDYTFDIRYTDPAGNAAEGIRFAQGTANEREFTIDRTAPRISVSYDNNDVRNGTYFRAGRVATITITEHNFDASRVRIPVTAERNKGPAPTPSWSSNGDVHTATLNFNTDGDYTLDISMTDRAGNENGTVGFPPVAAKSFTVDTEIQKPVIEGIENGHAYKGQVMPSVSMADINFADYTMKLYRTRKDDKDRDVTADLMMNLSTSAGGAQGTSPDFPEEEVNDGIYTLVVTMDDKAGNRSEQSMTFTVNRFGSVYEYGEYLRGLIANGGAYRQNIDEDAVITEYNADPLVPGSLHIEITRDGKPLDDVKVDVKPAINTEVVPGDSGWYQYRYVISKENFRKDGIYKISVRSKDAAGNQPETANDPDNEILFRVDSTPPELTSVTGLEKEIINAKEWTVHYSVFDAIGLKSVTIHVNGVPYGTAVTDFGSDGNNYTGSFTLKESDEPQHIRIVVEDQAGNVTDTDQATFTSTYSYRRDVTISTNFFVRWYANKGLFYGSVAGIIAIPSLLILLIAKRRKKEEE